MDSVMSLLQTAATAAFPESMRSPGVVFTLVWLAVGKLILGFVWEMATRTASLREHRVFRVPVPAGQRLREINSSWHVVSDAIYLYVLLRSGLMVLSPESFLTGVKTFAIFYVWVEVWYYFTHRWMHEYNWLYVVHRSHHLTRVVTPLSSISMSWVEKWVFYTMGWLTFMAALSWLTPISLGGIAAYYTFHFTISLHGHSNIETSRVASLLSRHLSMGSATSHALHHARFRVNYGFSNMLLDKLLGTYCDETETLQQRAVEKKGVEWLSNPERSG
jgi:Delta7-sterol 5-desaturase